MTASLTEDLSALTGEQVYHLVYEFDRMIIKAESAARQSVYLDPEGQQQADLELELRTLRADVLAQIARITVPIREAQGIIWRARHVRHYPVKVPGTTTTERH